MKKIVLAFAATIMAVAVLTGCAGVATCENYYNAKGRMEYINAQLVASAESYGDLYITDKCKAECKGNVITYTYTYSAMNTDDSLDDVLASELEKVIMGQIDAVRNECGVKDPITLRFVYCNPDGSVILDYSKQG